MKHHFSDLLYREGDYWSVVPNMERYAYSCEGILAGRKDITIATISKEDRNWERVLTLPNIVEITAHEPSNHQLEAISRLGTIKRLRITHARPKDLEFIASFSILEELVLEYVSGFSDLSPLQSLGKLKSLHLENLRRVNDFSGLEGIESLRYLRIDGTLDWKQPISDFEFLWKLPSLEVLSFGQVFCKSVFPALLPILSLKNLKKVSMTGQIFDAKEYALLSVGLEGVIGANWGPFQRFSYSSISLPQSDARFHLTDNVIRDDHPDVLITYTGERRIPNPEDEWFLFTGKNAGRVKSTSRDCEEKCAKYTKLFDSMKEDAKKLLDSSSIDFQAIERS